MNRTAFFVSDGTGITAETLGDALLSQFDGFDYRKVRLPYIDSAAKVEMAIEQINRTAEIEGVRPIVLDSIVDEAIRARLGEANALRFDVFGTFLAPLESELGIPSSKRSGRFHTVNNRQYLTRIDAMNFALNNDDGATGSEYANADIILTGVSRSGKTPSCVYLAMQFGVFAANYPITEDDLETSRLPASLQKYRSKLYGLTINPEHLAAIREERRPGSRYASVRQCEDEVRQVEGLFDRNHIPYLNATHMSVEEIATRIMMEKNIAGRK